MAENQTGKRLKVLRSDNGGEYKAFSDYLTKRGIRHQTTAPYTPEQNGVAERANRTLVEGGRTMLKTQGMEDRFWGEAIATAAYLRNRSPTKALDITPEEAWTGKKPSISHLRIFGCPAYMHVPKTNRSKLDSKTVKCIFVGYVEDSKSYKLYDEKSRKFLKSRDVIFDEYYRNPNEQEGSVVEQSHPELSHSSMEGSDTRSIPDNTPPEVELSPPSEEYDSGNASPIEGPTLPELIVGTPLEDTEEPQTTRRSTRFREPANIWMERKYPDTHAYAAIVVSEEPSSFTEAMRRDDSQHWQTAMKSEMKSIAQNQTWTLVKLPANRKAIDCKWVFKLKYQANGEIERYKARFVAKGYSQTKGIDYNETFAPVAKFVSIRALLAIAVMLGFTIHQMDVVTAFLNGELKEEIYMVQPEGFVEKGKEGYVCKLHKTLYGLKQSGRAWYMRIRKCLEEFNFRHIAADHSIFISGALIGGPVVIIALYVDDMILFTNDSKMLEIVKGKLRKEFEMKDLGELHYFLGIQVVRDKESGLMLSQKRYIEDVLKTYNMQDCKPASTPFDSSTKLTRVEGAERDVELAERYQSLVGSLMYAMLGTRPDIAYAVGKLSRYFANPQQSHWIAAKHVLRYLKGTTDLALKVGGIPTRGRFGTEVVGYVDSDYAGSLDDRRSTTGYVFKIGDGAVSWSSKRQPTVALSTTEAEYMATTQAGKEALWYRSFLEDIGIPQHTPTIIHNDNQGSLSLAKNPVFHTRTKHIDVQHHFIRELVEEGKVGLVFCETENMLADILTKGLSRDKHRRFREEMGLRTVGVSFCISRSGSVGNPFITKH
jgi:hypothetical protein